ncbi:MAG: hypothetical protein WCT33_04375 [Patescibacteria group bacterium]
MANAAEPTSLKPGDSILLSRHPLNLEMPMLNPNPFRDTFWVITLSYQLQHYLAILGWFLMSGHTPLKLRITLVNDSESDPSKHRAFFEVVFASYVLLFMEATDYCCNSGENKAILDGLFTIICDTYQVGIESNTLPYDQAVSAQEFILAEQTS